MSFNPCSPILSEIFISSVQIFLHSFKIELLILFLSKFLNTLSAAQERLTAVGLAVLISSTLFFMKSRSPFCFDAKYKL